MSIKSLLIMAVLVTAILCFGVPAKTSAAGCMLQLSSLDNAGQISCLNQAISDLMAQIAVLRAQQGDQGQTWCHTFNTNLGFANSGSDEAGHLKTALLEDGVWPRVALASKNNYDEETASYVVQFQAKYGITQTGYVGPKTRVKLNSLYGCSTNCPLYSRPLCKDGEKIVFGGYDQRGCALPGKCVPTACTPQWQCQWGPCTNGFQSQVPVDLNNCGSPSSGANIVCTALAKSCTQPTVSCDSLKNIISASFGKSCGDSLYNKVADLNKDKTVDSVDLLTFSSFQTNDDWCSAQANNNTDPCDYNQSSIKVISPNGGDFWTVGLTTVNMTWSTTNLEPSTVLKIDLYKDGQLTKNIGQGTVSYYNGSITGYHVPTDMPIGQYKLRVSKLDNSTIYDESDSTFTVEGTSSYLAIYSISPETGVAGSVVTLDGSGFWGDDKIKLTNIIGSGNPLILSPTGFAGTTSMTFNLPSSIENGAYNVVVTNSTSGVSNTVRLTVIGLSTQPSITVTSPTGGETWQIGTTQNIAWNSSGLPANATLSIGINGDGQTSTMAGGQIATNILASNKSYSWTIPSVLGESLAGKRYSVYATCLNCSGMVGYASDAYFSITAPNNNQPSITVSSPTAGQNWTTGTTQSISWTFAGITSPNIFAVTLYKNGIFVKTLGSILASAGSGGQTLQIPADLVTGSDYKVRVSKADDATIYGESAQFSVTALSVTQPVINLISPNGGDTWATSTAQTIRWSTNALIPSSDYLKIDLYKNGTYLRNIITQTLNNGVYSWNLPSTLGAGNDYKIRISKYSDGSIFAQSSLVFSIANPTPPSPVITITAPNGGETWTANNQMVMVTWTSNLSSADYVRVDLYKAGVQVWNISQATPNTGVLAFYVFPDWVVASDYRIRVSKVSDTSVFDESNANFTISTSTPAPQITLTVPNGNENWQKGTNQIISWTGGQYSAGTHQNVEIKLYYRDCTSSSKGTSINTYDGTVSCNGSQGSYLTIYKGDTSNNSYTWEVGRVTNDSINLVSTGSYYVEVCAGNTVAETKCDRGDFYFSVLPPSAQTTLRVNIPATPQGSGATVSIVHYNTTVINSSSYSVPTTINLIYKDNFTVSGKPISGYNITYSGTCSLSGLVGAVAGQNYVCDIFYNPTSAPACTDSDSGQNINVRGTTTGPDAYGGNMASIATYTDSCEGTARVLEFYCNNGQYIAMVNTPCAGGYVCSNGACVQANAQPSITVTAPNGNGLWTAGTSQNITWTSTGIDPSGLVKIDLLKYGSVVKSISSSTINSGSFLWVIPSTVVSGNNYKIRITKYDNPYLYDESNDNFSIAPAPISSNVSQSNLASISTALNAIAQIAQAMLGIGK